jgi:hypothetical protein
MGCQGCTPCRHRCPACHALQDAALTEWAAADSYSAVCAAWGRLGGRVLLHRRGHEYFAALARRTWQERKV